MLLPTLLFAQPKTERWGACVLFNDTAVIFNHHESFALHSVMKFPQAIYVADYLNRNGLALTDTIVVDAENVRRQDGFFVCRIVGTFARSER